MIHRQLLSTTVAAILALTFSAAAEPRSISGIHPSLATFNNEGECGTGAVVPWADRLWVISYAPHKPTGSSDKLYEITPDLRQIVRRQTLPGYELVITQDPNGAERLNFAPTAIDPFTERLRKRGLVPHHEGN